MHLASKCATLNDCSYTGDGSALPSARTCNKIRSAARNRLDPSTLFAALAQILLTSEQALLEHAITSRNNI